MPFFSYPKNTQKGIIAIEDAGYERVYSAKYGTYTEFKKIAKDGVPLKDGTTLKFKKDIDVKANDDFEHGINFWAIAYGVRNGPDLTFFWFSKDNGGEVIPTKALSEYFYLYEPFLKKRK